MILNINLNTFTGALIILAIIILSVFLYFKSKPSAKDKEKAEEFLKGLSDIFYSKMVEIVTNIKPEEFTDMIDFETNILNKIYDTLWDYTEEKIKIASRNDIVLSVSLRVIDKEFLKQFVDNVISSSDITILIKSIWNRFFEERIEELEKQEEVVYGIDENGNKVPLTGPEYNEDFDEKHDLKPVEESTKHLFEENYIQTLKPQSDNDEEELSEELLEDIFIDNNGRKHSKKTGRFVKED